MPSPAPDIPDRLLSYLNEIAEQLTAGHAAVMVGAGFSRNANRSDSSRTDVSNLSQPMGYIDANPRLRPPLRLDFPDWSELGNFFYSKLHPNTPFPHDQHIDVPKLAQEVEDTFGRPAVDRILLDAIPDRDTEPSPLHVKLLSLPWSDVFTTNYDTLLERACCFPISRRYSPVVTQEDLGHSTKPRIVKLHGSFPSTRPFIVTVEDYLRYPRTHGVFANTLRQSLVENTLCMIGFSGDDPNFVHWTSWIRDHLGHNAPKIYRVGLLSPQESQEQQPNHRNIVPVDMSEWSGVDGDRVGALERFLAYLQQATENNEDNRLPGSQLEQHTVNNRLEWPTPVQALASPEDTTDPSSLVRTWKVQRRSYPGWVIVPEDHRLSLWLKTKRWTRDLPSADSLPGFLDLEFAFELIWRMEKCLCPIFDNQIEFLEATLNRHLPAADSDTPLELPSATQDDQTARKLTRNDVRTMCHHLLLAVLRYCREEGRLEQWNSTCDTIHGRVTTMSPEHKARFYYERALSALFELNLQKLRKSIEEWPSDNSLPFWEAKKAGLLAEIGQVDNAGMILKNSLEAIRAKSNLKPITTDYSLVSEESFVMLLLHSVQLSLDFRKGEFLESEEVRKEFAERWHALLKYKCDPWNELKAFERTLDRQPASRSNVTRKAAFDIGRSVQTRHFWILDNEAFAAYGFLRFCEDAGLPFRIAGGIVATKSAAGALSHLANYSPSWAMVTLVRINDEKSVDRIFNRTSLARMDVASVDNLVTRYLEALDLAVADIRTGDHFRDFNFGIVLASVLPEILSRLCCKCSLSSKRRIVDFLIEVYQSDERGSYRTIRNLTERLLEAFSVDQRIDLIPRLLEFPVLSNLNALEKTEYVNPFALLRLERDSISVQPTLADDKLELLLEKASSDDAGTRKWALSTLGKLHDLGLLRAEHTKQFADALWGQLNDEGLPSNTNYYQHAFLTLPCPAEIEPVVLFKEYVRRTQFPVQTDPKRVTISRGRENTLCHEIQLARRHLDWSDDDVHSIVNRLVGWWDADKKNLKRTDVAGPFGSIADAFKERFSSLVDTLVAMITPRFNPTDGNAIRETLRRVTCELSEYGLAALRLEGACLHMFPERRCGVLQRIEDGMASSTEETVIDSLRAVLVLSARVESDAEDQEREDLIRILRVVGQILRWRREPGLPAAIDTIKHLTIGHPWTFAEDRERSVLDGLHHMIGDTAIHATGGPRLDTDGDGLDVFRKLKVRHTAASLAYALSGHYEKRGDPVPEAVREWESICRSDDEFAEIKNQWIVPSSV